jgi:hypothetical protein
MSWTPEDHPRWRSSGAARLLPSAHEPPLRTVTIELDELEGDDEATYNELRAFLGLPPTEERREVQFASAEDEELYAAWATHARVPRHAP